MSSCWLTKTTADREECQLSPPSISCGREEQLFRRLARLSRSNRQQQPASRFIAANQPGSPFIILAERLRSLEGGLLRWPITNCAVELLAAQRANSALELNNDAARQARSRPASRNHNDRPMLPIDRWQPLAAASLSRQRQLTSAARQKRIPGFAGKRMAASQRATGDYRA